MLIVGVYVCFSRVEATPPLGNLFIGGVSGSVVKTFECSPLLLRWGFRRFRVGGQPDAAMNTINFHTRFKTGYDF
jgi:hypothetical protein